MFRFQSLHIYQLSKELVKENYKITKGFPSDEKYVLVQQMNRAAISIPSNIAEGVSRGSGKEKLYFINIAYGSLMELVCQMEISVDLGYLEKEEYLMFAKKVKDLTVRMSNYTKTIV